ncbi:MAG TPA: ribulose-phosphate 3-epimerase [Fimbriimonadaceae bacterium]|nr:ribulose-phosphate 3-epimerase [Fimbriimonadaceae bacterium]
MIAPSILSFDHSDLATPVRKLLSAGAELIHLDVMDGQFVPPITIGDGVAKGLRKLGNFLLEAHLMTLTPERHFEAFVQAGCQRIIFHAEATAHAHRLVQTLHGMGVKAGIAINPGTPAVAVEPLLDSVDEVLVMTVNPGWGGQKFIESALDKVRWIRERAPNIDIEVDGGIDDHTLPIAGEAGANLFVVGSHLTTGTSIESTFRRLSALCG